MAVLTSDQLSLDRTTLANSLPDSADIKSVTLASNSGGGQTETVATVASAVACRLSAAQLTEQEQVLASKWLGRQFYRVRFANGQTLALGYRITISSATYEVIGISNSDTWEVARRCLVVKLS